MIRSRVLRLENLDGRIAPGGAAGGVIGTAFGHHEMVGREAAGDAAHAFGSKVGAGTDGVAGLAGHGQRSGEEIPT